MYVECAVKDGFYPYRHHPNLTDKGKNVSEAENQELAFAKRLKAETTGVHDSVDNLVMSVQPFSSKENYIKFLKLQSVFHKAVDHIYKDAELNKAIPELEYMARYDAVTQDLKDLGEEPYKFDKELPHETGNKAIGWLYCAEGSNLGAAFLFKHAQKLEYNGEHGARHLAPPSCRARQTLACLCRASERFELDPRSRSGSHPRCT